MSPPAVLVLDLTGLKFLGSAGLALLVRCDLLCQDRGNQLRIVAANGAVLRPITLTGLDKVLTTVPSLAEAVTTS